MDSCEKNTSIQIKIILRYSDQTNVIQEESMEELSVEIMNQFCVDR